MKRGGESAEGYEAYGQDGGGISRCTRLPGYDVSSLHAAVPWPGTEDINTKPRS